MEAKEPVTTKKAAIAELVKQWRGLLDEETERPSSSESSTAESSEATTVVEGGSGTATPRRKITLDSPVTSNGDNFSQGTDFIRVS